MESRLTSQIRFPQLQQLLLVLSASTASGTSSVFSRFACSSREAGLRTIPVSLLEIPDSEPEWECEPIVETALFYQIDHEKGCRHQWEE
jgi:hypothetical protein